MEIFKEFGLNPILLAAQIVNFTILLVLLRLFLYKPVLKMLEERRTKVASSLKTVEEIENRFEELNSEQEKILEKARTEASKIVAESKEESKELAEKSLVETKKTVAAMIKRSEERLGLEQEKMMTEVKKALTELVVIATTKVVQKTMDGETNKKIVEETIKEISK